MKNLKWSAAVIVSISTLVMSKATVHATNPSSTDPMYIYVSDSCYWEHHLHKTTTEFASHSYHAWGTYFGTPDNPTCEYYDYREYDSSISYSQENVDETDAMLTQSLIEVAPSGSFDQDDTTETSYTDFSEDTSLNTYSSDECEGWTDPDNGWWYLNESGVETTGYESYLRLHTFT